jgi:hypothetical protein
MRIDRTTKKYYDEVLKTGMFHEFYPTLTGDWEIDEVKWKFIQENQIDPETLTKKDKEEEVSRIVINKDPSFVEVWHEGYIESKGERHYFWLIDPQGVDPRGNEYAPEVRWFFARVPREVRVMYNSIIEAFKQKKK